MSTAATEPWARQAQESAPAHAAFQTFRDLGPGRSIRKAYERHQNSIGRPASARVPGGWTKWGWRHHWAARAAAWDEHVQREADTATVRHRRRVQARHQGAAELLAAKLIAGLERLDFGTLGPREFIRATRELFLLERLVCGSPLGEKPALETLHAPALPAPPPLDRFEPPVGFVEEVLAILDERHAAASEPEDAPAPMLIEEEPEPPSVLPLPAAKRRARRTVAAGR
jgi:hypothetical protein